MMSCQLKLCPMALPPRASQKMLANQARGDEGSVVTLRLRKVRDLVLCFALSVWV